MELGLTWLGLVSLMVTLVIAALVYKLQSKADKAWGKRDLGWKTAQDESVRKLDAAVAAARDEVGALTTLVQEFAEQRALSEEERIKADSAPEAEAPTTLGAGQLLEPANLEEYRKDLRNRAASLNLDTLSWTKRVRCDGDQRGNLGWFVTDGTEKRYFIHRGRTTTVRPAIPSRLLEAWQEQVGRKLCEIESDYQTGEGRGNHAWYVRIYGGETWRVSMGGQRKENPTVTLIN